MRLGEGEDQVEEASFSDSAQEEGQKNARVHLFPSDRRGGAQGPCEAPRDQGLLKQKQRVCGRRLVRDELKWKLDWDS